MFRAFHRLQPLSARELMMYTSPQQQELAARLLRAFLLIYR